MRSVPYAQWDVLLGDQNTIPDLGTFRSFTALYHLAVKITYFCARFVIHVTRIDIN